MNALRRINDGLLGVWERPALKWMGGRLPAALVPDYLTAFGACGALLTAAGYVLANVSLKWLWLANVGLVVNWVGDSLDGTLARLRHIERRRYGFFIDHTTDLFSQTLIFMSLGLSPLAHFGVACAGLIVFLMAFVYALVTVQTRATMRITYCYFGPTEIRALLFLGNLLTIFLGVIDLRALLPAFSYLRSASLHDLFIGLLSMLGFITIALLAIRDGRALSAEDPPPR